MLDDPRFWLYWVLFFSAAGLTRLVISLFRKKSCASSCLYFALSLASLTMFWLVRGNFFFRTYREGALFCFSAMLPGGVAGLHFILLLLPVPLVAGSVMYLNLSLAPPFRAKESTLGTLTCYPGREKSLFVEWTGQDGKPVLGYLEGEKCCIYLRKTVLPDYFFFLESPWEVLGILSRYVNPADLPLDAAEYYIPILSPENKNPKIKTFEYPALRFLDPGYFNSYTYVIRNNRDLVITERKSTD